MLGYRPTVIARKIGGGSRFEEGTAVRRGLTIGTHGHDTWVEPRLAGAAVA
ncbi:MAG TPA: hypothetical protein VIJ28_08375 [Chloroflexota bacterium]